MGPSLEGRYGIVCKAIGLGGLLFTAVSSLQSRKTIHRISGMGTQTIEGINRSYIRVIVF